MKMKRKHTLYNSNQGITSSEVKKSASSEKEDGRRQTRLSLSKIKGGLKYNAVEDTTTSDSSNPKKIDHYEFDFVDEIPVETKIKTKTNVKKIPRSRNQANTNNKLAKPRMKKSNATSTPVLIGQTPSDSRLKKKGTRLLITPEITPILPVQPNERNGSLDDSFNTPTVRSPTIRRSLRKRSWHLESSGMTEIKSESSQTDSGIVISPPEKKLKSNNSSSSLITDLNPVIQIEKLALSTIERMRKAPKQGKVLTQMSPNKMFAKLEGVANFFETDPRSALSSSDKNVPKKTAKRIAKPKVSNKLSYRSKNSFDSGLESPFKNVTPDSCQENCMKFTKSPTLFSDDFFSDDTADFVPKVNKSSSRSYTSLKRKPQLNKKQMSKLDCLANEFNSQFDDIEKFELFIESE